MSDPIFAIRVGPSGPDMALSTVGNVLTVVGDGTQVQAQPRSEGSASPGLYTATDALNIFDTSATADFVAPTGSGFGQTFGSSLDFTASGCVVTYVGAAPQRFLARLWVSVNQTTPDGNATAFLGVDVNGDLVGQAALNNFPSIQATLLDSDGNVFFLASERIFSLALNGTVRPALALVAVVPGTTVSISRLTLTLEPVRA